LSSDIEPLQRFMQKIAKMAAMKQTDLRLSMAEAAEISAALAAILLQRPPPAAQPSSPPVMVRGIDGGRFGG